MKHLGIAVIALLVLQFAAAPPAAAKGKKGFKGVCKMLIYHPDMYELNDDQVKQIKDLCRSFKVDMAPHKAEYVRLQGHLKALWIDPGSNTGDFSKVMDDLLKVKQKKHKIKVDFIKKLRGILEPYQWVMLPNPFCKKSGKSYHKGKKMMMKKMMMMLDDDDDTPEMMAAEE